MAFLTWLSELVSNISHIFWIAILHLLIPTYFCFGGERSKSQKQFFQRIGNFCSNQWPLYSTKNYVPMKYPLRHLGIIMDGNRRYGAQMLGNPFEGHRRGAKKLWEVVKWCVDLHIETLSVFAFSMENWNRKEGEVEMLMSLFRESVSSIDSVCGRKCIIVRFLTTSIDHIPDDIRKEMKRIERKTREKAYQSDASHAMHINVFVSYGGRQEIIRAVKILVEECRDLSTAEIGKRITEDYFSQKLLTAGHGGDPDLILRTSGESRMSNFLLWQSAYAEFFVEESLWPELTRVNFLDILFNYSKRSRRFGK